MLYPLSYEGLHCHATYQQSRGSARAYRVVPARVSWACVAAGKLVWTVSTGSASFDRCGVQSDRYGI
jgi:hypothetical protein